MKKGQVQLATLGYSALAFFGTWLGAYVLNSPVNSAAAIKQVESASTAAINELKTEVTAIDNRVDKVCIYSLNQTDRMDKNLQSIARAVKADVVTGSDKDNPCIKR